MSSLSDLGRDQYRYVHSQWEMSLHCNDICHWLGAHLDWSTFVTALLYSVSCVGLSDVVSLWHQTVFCYHDDIMTLSTLLVIKSPQYTGGDFMFLYRFVCRRRPQILVHAITFERHFWISFIFSTIVGPDLQITWLDFGRFSSWPWPRFFKVKYGICYISAKNGPIATKRKANISIEL